MSPGMLEGAAELAAGPRACSCGQSEHPMFESAVEEIRALANLCDMMPESWSEQFDMDQLRQLLHAQRASGWDILPHQWSQRQLFALLADNKVPRFDEQERPLYDDPLEGCSAFTLSDSPEGRDDFGDDPIFVIADGVAANCGSEDKEEIALFIRQASPFEVFGYHDDGDSITPLDTSKKFEAVEVLAVFRAHPEWFGGAS